MLTSILGCLLWDFVSFGIVYIVHYSLSCVNSTQLYRCKKYNSYWGGAVVFAWYVRLLGVEGDEAVEGVFDGEAVLYVGYYLGVVEVL